VSSPASDQRTGRAVTLASAYDEGWYGGKAVQLGEAVRAGLPVPPGVALPVSLVQAVVLGRPEARRCVELACRMLGPGALAVRSSAVGEDGEGASFAGQHATVLNAADVVDAVLQVAGSACKASAAAYRARLGRPAGTAIGVVLQRLVASEVAGVLFTCDPLSGRDELVIEASWALGEAVVSGLVSPDLYRLGPCGEVLHVYPGRKDIAVVPRPGGGTLVVGVDAVRARQPCLDARHLTALVALAARVREVWPGHSDLEWAYGPEGLALLQRRPVTTGPGRPGA
jgi:pyruvate,water dikinase